jgi:O-antigen/teichoic acid export membrane protein
MTWRPGKLAVGTFTVGIGMGLRSLTQALVFLIVARILGADGFGSFAAVLAIAAALSYFSGLGANILLVRDIVRDPYQFSVSWGYTLSAYCLGMPIAALVYGLTAWLVLPATISWNVRILLGVSEIALIPLAGFAVFAYQGREQMGKVSWIQLVPPLVRLAGALIFFAVHQVPNTFDLLLLWSWLYFCCALAAVIYVMWCVNRDFGRPLIPGMGNLFKYVRNSIPFSFSGIAERLYSDADKFMLASLASVCTAGLYSAGYRFVDLAYIPLHALMSTAAPRYFRFGQSGIAAAVRYSLKIGIIPLCYGIAIGCLMYWSAPLLAILLGPAYKDAIPIARWLAWLPLVAVPRILLHYPLATSGLQHVGMKALLIGASVNIGLNILWIPQWSWRGAVLATYAAEGCMIIVMLLCIVKSWHLNHAQ